MLPSFKMASQMAPSPPNDAETKTIIDKLANFVARNGPEFEKMTMEKKKDDPKFSFLFGGQHNPYYRWKVEMETSEQMPSRSNSGTSTGQPTAGPPDSSAQLIESLHAVRCKEQDDARKYGTAMDPFEMEFNRVVQPVMNTCSKEAIASGKSWILSRSHSAEDCGKMAHFMMKRSLEYPGVEFNHKLHLVYLINDILYHGHSSPLQEGNDLKQAIQTVIVQIIFNVFTTAPQKADELIKIVNNWESQNCLNTDKLHQIKTILNYPIDKLPISDSSPSKSKQEQPMGGSDPPKPPWLQYSNNQFQRSSWQAQQPPPQYPPWDQPPPVPPTNTSHPPPPPPWVGHQQNQNPPPPPWRHPPPPPPQQSVEPTPLFAPSDNFVGPSTDNVPPPPPVIPLDERHEIPDDNVDIPGGGPVSIDYNHKPSLLPPPDDYHQPPGIQVFDYQHRPANWRDGPLPMGGPPPSFPFSGPPQRPFFPRPPFHPHDIPPHVPPPPLPPPSLPYFDLPAGLMIPLVPLHEHDYAPLKPHLVCLPAPQPPSERLLEAVDEFYYPPSQEKPRNEEGWEAKALLDFYNAKEKAKENAKDRSRDARRSSRRRRSRSNSPRRSRRRSSSRSPSPYRKRRRRSSRSPSTSSSDSRSPSPHKRRRRRHSSTNSSSSLSPSTPTIEEIAYRNKYKTSAPQAKQDSSLKSDNVGHQLLKRMGWEGAGLGARGQGIQEPIKGGEARDKLNQYSGVGINMKDPFEQFRRNKSYTFNRRSSPGGGASGGVAHE